MLVDLSHLLPYIHSPQKQAHWIPLSKESRAKSTWNGYYMVAFRCSDMLTRLWIREAVNHCNAMINKLTRIVA
eukprot:358514-Chlamydomonas_euryale.AAC.2